MTLQIALIVGILLVIVVMLLQVRGWRRGDIPVTQSQKRLRVASGLLLIIIMGMLIMGGQVSKYGPMAMLIYWMVCMILLVVLIFLSLLDMREVSKHWAELQKRNLRDLSSKVPNAGDSNSERRE